MACIKGFDFGLYAKVGHHLAHRAQHAGGVGHDVIGFCEIHCAAIKRTDFGQTFSDVGDAFGGPHHVCAIHSRKRFFDAAKHDIATHASSQVQDKIRVRGADQVGDFAVQIKAARRDACFGVAHMAMHNGRPRFGGGNRAVGNLFGGTRHMGAAILCAARSCNCGCDKHVAVHF